MNVKFLGTGANGGTPQIDCNCKNCEKAKKDHSESRLRSSLLVETTKHKFILDCGPDFRQQLLSVKLGLQDVTLIAITHLHFDHVEGLMELSGGKTLNVPVLVSKKNREILRERRDISFLERAGFLELVSKVEGEKLGVELEDIPHDPRFPTSAVVVKSAGKEIWYSPDVRRLTKEILDKIRGMDLVVFDGTFLNDSVYPARKYNHITIEESAPELVRVNRNIIYSHINHSEELMKVRKFLAQFGFKLAEDGANNEV